VLAADVSLSLALALALARSLAIATAGGHINPAVTFGLFLARKLSLTRAVFYIIMQCLGAICGAGVVKGFQQTLYMGTGGGANAVNPGYTKGDGLGAEIVGTFVLVYTVFSATDAKRSARDSHVPILAPLPIGFAVFLVHLRIRELRGRRWTSPDLLHGPVPRRIRELRGGARRICGVSPDRREEPGGVAVGRSFRGARVERRRMRPHAGRGAAVEERRPRRRGVGGGIGAPGSWGPETKFWEFS